MSDLIPIYRHEAGGRYYYDIYFETTMAGVWVRSLFVPI